MAGGEGAAWGREWGNPSQLVQSCCPFCQNGCLEGKKHCPNHSRENLQLPEKRVGGQEGLRNLSPGEPPLVPSPARSRLRAPSQVPGLSSGPGTQALHPGCPSPAPGQKKTPPGWSQDITVCQRVPHVAPVSLCRKGSRIKKRRRGGQFGGMVGGRSLPQHWAQGSGLWAGGLQDLGGVGPPVCRHEGEKGSQSLRSR